MMTRAIATLALACAVFVPAAAHAHRLKPAVLELREEGNGRVSVRFTKPVVNQSPVPLEVTLLSDCVEVTTPSVRTSATLHTTRWMVRCSGTLVGKTLEVQGLEETGGDVFVKVALHSGQEISTVLTRNVSRWEIPEASEEIVSIGYLPIGIEHILLGPDHLLFVLGLCLLVGMRSRALVGAISAFTLGHSVTLALAVLGIVTFRAAPVEALIALSVLFLAAEVASRRRDATESLASRRPWIVSGAFGLLHGFGFAGALSEVGMPRDDIPFALLWFNLGVEVGQLLFVVVILGVLAASPRLDRVPVRRWHVAYAMGALAAFWFLERTVLIFA